MEALAEVLKDYGGTVLFVSHDRRFLSQTANRILSIQDRKICTFMGSYAEFQERRNGAERPLEESLLILEHRLADLTGRLSMPGPDDDIAELDRQFKDVAAQLRTIRAHLIGKKNPAAPRCRILAYLCAALFDPYRCSRC